MKTLGEVLQPTETVNPLLLPQTEFEYIDVSSVSNSTFEIETTQRLKGKDAPSRARKLVRAGDILFATVRPTLRRIAMVPPNFDQHVCSTGYLVLRPSPGLDPRFVFHFLFTEPFMGQMELLQKGTSYPAVTDGDVRAQKIAFPPLAEQQRIVGLLDEAFVDLATAKSIAERNLQDARSLFESHLQYVFTRRGKGWTERPLAELCDRSRVITYGVIKLGDETPTGVPCVRTSNVRWLRLETNGLKRIAPSLSAEYSRTVLRGGEVLVNVRGTLGGVAVALPSMHGWNVSREVAVVPVDDSRINPSFLCYLIGSGVTQRWLASVKKGAAYVGINIEDLRLLPVAAPKLEEQFQLAEHLDELWRQIQTLEDLYRQRVFALEAFRKSLLNHAFRGAL